MPFVGCGSAFAKTPAVAEVLAGKSAGGVLSPQRLEARSFVFNGSQVRLEIFVP